ncbi:A/G-specific adenine glycosylase [Novosphingobium album (ex Hu et al. 2023)]|uniref:Adenine DNA glycosylase n=1 Tax=Novosphingobium album (ex Hu et al. 2023) TaxID=2930093 RepID=A0ABT0B0Q1_9SPHN|nr:A/G-specific adenine glycosylase [Novosphingobium album (ex Hu et al. 2023)]MCJ2178509.1 A/G-specific adenine glycosylase [Novosphingobium album (ex Hu et al. 2023)]
MDASSDAVGSDLLAWYDAHARDLPWRAPPGTPAPDPYRVWLSEVMLQQTTVAAVKDYFTAFTSRWPAVEALAAAGDEEVMAAWAGLGYYARARNLLACAREVAARGGHFPDTEEGLRALPGLGAYTAAAVAAIAFGRRAVVVDANVERVVARLFAIGEPLPGARTMIREKADAITPDARSGDFAQAMMDLGATVCTSRSPRCLLCPLSGHCTARAMGEPDRFPVKAPKKAKPARRGQAFWIEQEEQVWLVRRPGKGMLGGMRALPDDNWSARADGSGEGPLSGPWESAGKVSHTFTHFGLDLHLAVYLGADWTRLPPGEGEWWPLDRLDEAGLPTLFAKAARLALSEREA